MAAVPAGAVSPLRAALYLRLSRDDAGEGESVSIGGQRALLQAYAGRRGWTVAGEYVDDGFSGTSFQRPGLRRLLADVEAGRVDVVLTKDLSRLGRDYIRTGELAEVYFPSRHVRYIAVNDGFDTQGPDAGLAPFQHVVNEMYARDASKKIKSALAVRWSQGRYVGSLAPYGYRKDPADKNRLLPDPSAAAVVREIFSLAAEGAGPGEIARRLNGRGTVCPALYRAGRLPGPDGPWWSPSTVSKLLRNPTYLGCTAQGRTRKPSFRAPSREAVPRAEWVVVEGTHPALVSREDFMAAGRGGRSGRGAFHNRLAGLVRCADCGRPMVSSGTRRRDSPAVLVCGAYKRLGPAGCGSHAIHYPVLLDLVGRALRRALALTEEERAWVNAELLRRARSESGTGEERELERELARLDRLEGELWDSRLRGEVGKERLHALLARYRDRRQAVLERLEDLRHRAAEPSVQAKALSALLERTLAAPEEDQSLLLELVEEITVGQRYQDGEEGSRPAIQEVTVRLRLDVPGTRERLERRGRLDHSEWTGLSSDTSPGAAGPEAG